MTCQSALSEKSLSIASGMLVEDALALMQQKNADHAAVVERDGAVSGVFSYAALLRNALPVTVSVTGGLDLDISIPAAPGAAKRLRNMEVMTVDQLMDRKFPVAAPEMPLRQGIALLLEHKGPVVVMDRATGQYVGLLTEESAIKELRKTKD